MKTLIATLLALLLIINSSFSQTLAFARQAGGTGDDVGYSIAVDNSGNQYITGYFTGTADFDPGTGVFNLTSAGAEDIFILKLNASGALVWVRQIGGPGSDYGKGISVDGNGNVFIIGNFINTVDFDPSPATFNLTSNGGSRDVFVTKLDPSGNLVWVKQFGGPNPDNGNAITVDVNGNVYATGGFNGTVDFDPSAGTYQLTTQGLLDVFVCKLNNNGDFIWARRMGGSYYDEAFSIAIDKSGNVITTGRFQSSADFDPGPNTIWLVQKSSDSDVFLSKLDSSGNYVWAKQLSPAWDGNGNVYSYGLTVDASGNIYTTGKFNGWIDFDPAPGTYPGPGTYLMQSVGDFSTYVWKVNSSGEFLWAKCFGGCLNAVGNSIALDNTGNLYIAGAFNYISDFDPGSGVYNVESYSGDDGYLIKLNSSGQFVWVTHLGGTWNYDISYSVAVDAQNNVYTTGQFADVSNFYPGLKLEDYSYYGRADYYIIGGTYNLTSFGGVDVYVQKLSQSLIALPTKFVDFSVAKEKENAILNWTVSNNEYANEYLVQHSSDGASWTDIQVLRVPGISNRTNQYSFVHSYPSPGINFYRIKEVENDGKFRYSNIRSLTFSTSMVPFIVLNNPVYTDNLNLNVNTSILLLFYNETGAVLWQKQFNPGPANINVSGYKKGVYVLKGGSESVKIIIN
jgi:hypothetical protein